MQTENEQEFLPMSSDKETFTGEVIWFDARKGLGFIRRDDGRADIYVYYTDITMPGYKIVMKGDKVSFVEDYSFNNRLKAGEVVISGVSDPSKSEERQSSLRANRRPMLSSSSSY
jgi:CspA family cold shock protein